VEPGRFAYRASTNTTTDGGRGWLGRVGGGCDYQFAVGGFGDFVIGAFADYDFMGLNGTNLPNELVIGGPGGVTSPLASNVHETDAWYAGARLGYLPYPNLMTFVSGGWTGTRFTMSPEFMTFNGAAAGFTFPGAYTVNGWFLGGGYEYGCRGRGHRVSIGGPSIASPSITRSILLKASSGVG